MLETKQCEILLKENIIRDLKNIFSRHGLTDIKIFSPQFSDQYHKINFLVTESDNADPLAVSDTLKEIKKFLQYKDINIFSANILDEELKPLIEKEIIEFSEKGVQDYYHKIKVFDISYSETAQTNVITITIPKNVPYNKDSLLENCSKAVQNEIDAKRVTSKIYSFF